MAIKPKEGGGKALMARPLKKIAASFKKLKIPTLGRG